MEGTGLAHRGEHAGEQAVAWQPEQVQSGPRDGSPGPLTLASALGWFSLGLGAAQIIAPQKVTALVGAKDTPGTRLFTRAMGVREITHGLGILTSTQPTPWVWSRVLGDALDLGALGSVLRSGSTSRARTLGAVAAVAGTTGTDVLDGLGLGRSRSASTKGPMVVKAAVTIDRTPEAIYGYWRDFENLPDIMTHLESVEHMEDGLTRWQARAPLGASVAWTAEVTEDTPHERIAWRSIEGSMVQTTGEVRILPAPGDRGTELHVWLTYDAPIGPLGAALLKLFGDDPVQQVKDDLRRFKQVMETGQVVRSEGAPKGIDARHQPKQLPAQHAAG
ncbi:MAG: cyclase/dehydrase [Thermoleophilia bacterium]|nr:cyclase/dehydrase [Thermoleophilia bacterium]